MTLEERRSAAETILNIPFFNMLMDEIEREQTERCIFADMNDDDTRRNAATQVRAVRTLRSRLAALSKDGQAPASRKAPA